MFILFLGNPYLKILDLSKFLLQMPIKKNLKISFTPSQSNLCGGSISSLIGYRVKKLDQIANSKADLSSFKQHSFSVTRSVRFVNINKYFRLLVCYLQLLGFSSQRFVVKKVTLQTRCLYRINLIICIYSGDVLARMRSTTFVQVQTNQAINCRQQPIPKPRGSSPGGKVSTLLTLPCLGDDVGRIQGMAQAPPPHPPKI